MIGAYTRSSTVLSIKANAATCHGQESRSLVRLSNHHVQAQTVTIYLNVVSYFNSSCQQQVPQWGAVVHDKRVPPPLHVQINICWLSAAVLLRPYVRGVFRYRGYLPHASWSIKIKRTLLNRTLRRHFPNKQFIVFFLHWHKQQVSMYTLNTQWWWY